MKAGIAGSSPDGAVTRKSETSLALAALLNRIGDTVHNINTIVVGLDAVEAGHEKPGGLDISWTPADRVASARKARKFALEAVLVSTSEAIAQYVSAVTRLPRFDQMRAEWKKQQDSGESVSAADRLESLCKAIIADDGNFLSVASMLLVIGEIGLFMKTPRQT